METNEKLNLITGFCHKHELSSPVMLGDENVLVAFSGGNKQFFNFEDIEYDMENNVKVGVIQQYNQEGKDSVVTQSFKEWYESKSTTTQN